MTATRARIVPPPPEPTLVSKGGLPRVPWFWIFGGMLFGFVVGVAAAVFEL